MKNKSIEYDVKKGDFMFLFLDVQIDSWMYTFFCFLGGGEGGWGKQNIFWRPYQLTVYVKAFRLLLLAIKVEPHSEGKVN